MLGIAIHKWREVLRDQWDLRDLDWRNDTEAAAKVPGAADAGVRPFVNSHYSRQLLGIWALVGGLSAQQHDAVGGTLSFARPEKGERWPFFTATGNGHLVRATAGSNTSSASDGDGDACFEVVLFSGRLRATVVVDGKALVPAVDLMAGGTAVVCARTLR
jgi:hypothetical protein